MFGQTEPSGTRYSSRRRALARRTSGWKKASAPARPPSASGTAATGRLLQAVAVNSPQEIAGLLPRLRLHAAGRMNTEGGTVLGRGRTDHGCLTAMSTSRWPHVCGRGRWTRLWASSICWVRARCCAGSLRAGRGFLDDLLGAAGGGQDDAGQRDRQPRPKPPSSTFSSGDQRHQGDPHRHAGRRGGTNRRFGEKTIGLCGRDPTASTRPSRTPFCPLWKRAASSCIGATTENPSFEVNGALLSRCRVFVLKSLSEEDLMQLLRRALTSPRGFGRRRWSFRRRCCA